MQSKNKAGHEVLIPIVGAGPSLLDIVAHKPEPKRKLRHATNVRFKSSAAVPALQDSSVSSRIRRRLVGKTHMRPASAALAPPPREVPHVPPPADEPLAAPAPPPLHGDERANDSRDSDSDGADSADSNSSFDAEQPLAASDADSDEYDDAGDNAGDDADGVTRQGVPKHEQVAHPEYPLGQIGKLVHDTRLQYLAAHCPFHKQMPCKPDAQEVE